MADSDANTNGNKGNLTVPPGPRCVANVITEMLEKIPSYEKSLIEELSKVREEQAYKSPELQTECWGRISRILWSNIPEPDAPWHFEVLSVYSTLPVDKLKKYYKGENL